MMPVFILVSILTILGTMQIFDLIISLRPFDVDVPITRILFSMLDEQRTGYACACSLVFGAMLLTVSMIQIRLSKRMQKNL